MTPIDVDIRIRINGVDQKVAAFAQDGRAREIAADLGIEAARQPVINTDYSGRRGFDSNFIGIETPLPTVTDVSKVARLLDGSGHRLLYEHFTIIMHTERRLALLTASNVNYDPEAKRPEPGDYSRTGLNGFGPSDRGEIWLIDDRLPSSAQLDNTFYDRDRGAFDKGHVVRREDVCFGGSYRQVQQANGDTFHSTNCTPQRKDFNQSREEGIWGQLEDFIKAQADTERLSLFAGPVLDPDDRWFDGRDGGGPVRVQIPSRFWKVVCANAGGDLQVFAFVLEQRVNDITTTEFAVTNRWRRKMVSLSDLEGIVPLLKFGPALHDADQFQVREVARAKQRETAAAH